MAVVHGIGLPVHGLPGRAGGAGCCRPGRIAGAPARASTGWAPGWAAGWAPGWTLGWTPGCMPGCVQLVGGGAVLHPLRRGICWGGSPAADHLSAARRSSSVPRATTAAECAVLSSVVSSVWRRLVLISCLCISAILASRSAISLRCPSRDARVASACAPSSARFCTEPSA